ncbi:transposase [Streptomyces sp. NPDC093094]|uniref:transposase n=1 Tax=Streptomyces sp. NPDC093094 TaxID=3366026 RepID=UPI0037F9B9EF
MPAPSKYPDELCERAVREVRTSGRPVSHAARDLGIHKKALRGRVRRAEAGQGSRPGLLTTAERTELTQLCKETAGLRRADETLKAASVFSRRSSTGPARGRRGDQPPPRRLRSRAGVPGTRPAGPGTQHPPQAARIRGQRRCTTVPEPSAPGPPDLVNRHFEACRPNQPRVAGLTCIRTRSGWVHAAFVLDVYSRMIVGWQPATHMRTDLPPGALETALWRRGVKKGPGLIRHSDRGSQGEFNWSLQHRAVGASVAALRRPRPAGLGTGPLHSNMSAGQRRFPA